MASALVTSRSTAVLLQLQVVVVAVVVQMLSPLLVYRVPKGVEARGGEGSEGGGVGDEEEGDVALLLMSRSMCTHRQRESEPAAGRLCVVLHHWCSW